MVTRRSAASADKPEWRPEDRGSRVFTAEQRILLGDLGVTKPQASELERALDRIEGAMARTASQAAIRDSLEQLVSDLKSVRRVVCAPPGRDSVDWQAAGLLQIEAAKRDVDKPERRIPELGALKAFEKLVPFALLIAERARASVPAGQSRGMSSPSQVVESILNALATPQDSKSKDLAKRAAPVRGDHSRGSKNPFPEIAQLCIEAVTGRVDADLDGVIQAWRRWRPGVLAMVVRRHEQERVSSKKQTPETPPRRR